MSSATQEFLDTGQYQRDGIEAYEAVFGRDFVSPGGKPMALSLISRLELGQGARVLDVGCGLGGSAFLMADKFGFKVDGIDLPTNMIAMAKEKLTHYNLEDVRLWHGDCLSLDVENVYDGIYSRDAFLHIHEKDRLFRVLFRALRPGARLLLTDYCGGGGPWTEELMDYVSAQDYCLHTLNEYVAIVEAAGFVQVRGEDKTDAFIKTLEIELSTMQRVSLNDGRRREMKQGWQEKLARAKRHEQGWILLQALRPEE